MSNTFDCEFNFTDGNFNQAIYDACAIQDTIGDRQAFVENKVLEIKNIFNNMTSLNLHQFSTYMEHDNKNYKITVTNPNWNL